MFANASHFRYSLAVNKEIRNRKFKVKPRRTMNDAINNALYCGAHHLDFFIPPYSSKAEVFCNSSTFTSRLSLWDLHDNLYRLDKSCEKRTERNCLCFRPAWNQQQTSNCSTQSDRRPDPNCIAIRNLG